MKFDFPEELPITQKLGEIERALKTHSVLIIAGDTGSGKSTQLPKLCLRMGYGKFKPIAHTQPRRIAATALATRISKECEVNLGEEIGYKIRFSSQVSKPNDLKKTELILMTDGILLAEMEQDVLLRKYNLIIIDEAHERSLNIDFLLGCLKKILESRKDLKIIITSATLDLKRFSDFFNQAPIIEIQGRTYPVETRYRPLLAEQAIKSGSREAKSLSEGILEAVLELDHEFRKSRGDILVFLPTERDIYEVEEVLNKAHLFNTEILLLFARLTLQAQQKIFQTNSVSRRIILSTNVAETSITVPNIFYVIDSGLVRIKRYNSRSKVERLPIENISKASANQRQGRCGRIAPGVCIRLYSQDDFVSRSDFTDPEILRSNLASVILKMKILKLGEIENFNFLERPENNLIKDGYVLLEELEAISAVSQNNSHERALTKIGYELSKYPVDPRLGRILVAGKTHGVLEFILIIVSALAVQDPRIRPMEAQTKADQLHKKYTHPDSDFLSFLILYRELAQEKNNLSKNKFLEYLNQNFISPMRYREWISVYQELNQELKQELNLKNNIDNLDYLTLENINKKSLLIHRALLSGLLGHIGHLDLKKDLKKELKNDSKNKIYLGGRGISFQIFPGSVLGKKTPAWIAAYELVETQKIYARIITEVNPDEVERAASHLVKKQYFEPHWLQEGFVGAFEKISLYGLELIPRRRVNFSRVDVKTAREFFIRGFFIENVLSERLEKEAEQDLDFWLKNKNLKEELIAFEHQHRTSGVLVDDEQCFHFFNNLIPEDLADFIKFKKYYLNLNLLEKNKFLYTREFLLAYTPSGNTVYPSFLNMGSEGLNLNFSYCFEPGNISDGVTLEIPLALLNQINLNLTSYLIPPLFIERVENLIKTLPKSKRLACSPAGTYAQVLLDVLKNQLEQDKNFKEKNILINFMAQELSRITRIKINPEEFQENLLDPHLRMNFRLRDLNHNILSESRDLDFLRSKFQEKAEQETQVLHQASASGFQAREGIIAWDFGLLEEKIEIEKSGVKYTAYPALIDQKILEQKESVKLQALSSLDKAYEESEQGLLRLLILNLPKEVMGLKKKIAGIESFIFNLKTSLNFNKNNNKNLVDDYLKNYLNEFVSRVFIEVFEINDLKNKPNNLPRSQNSFEKRVLEKKSELLTYGLKLIGCLNKILGAYQEILENIKAPRKMPMSVFIKKDIETQLEYLIYPGFILHTPMKYLERYEIYLRAILIRLEKYQEIKDKELRAELNQVWNKYLSQPEIPLTAEIHYLIEELRVSLFAQNLKAEKGVSVKKLLEMF